MEREDLVQRVCAGYCPFYKPGKPEDLSCKGFAVVQGLIREGRDIESSEEHDGLNSETEEALFQTLCRACPFYGSDCDFAGWKRGGSPEMARKDVTPCGGFLFLCSSLKRGDLDIETIHGVI